MVTASTSAVAPPRSDHSLALAGLSVGIVPQWVRSGRRTANSSSSSSILARSVAREHCRVSEAVDPDPWSRTAMNAWSESSSMGAPKGAAHGGYGPEVPIERGVAT